MTTQQAAKTMPKYRFPVTSGKNRKTFSAYLCLAKGLKLDFPKKAIATGAGMLSLALVGCSTTATHSAERDSDAMMNNRAVETDQQLCFSTSAVIECPTSGEFYGQDARIPGIIQSYIVHGDGTVTDNGTGKPECCADHLFRHGPAQPRTTRYLHGLNA